MLQCFDNFAQKKIFLSWSLNQLLQIARSDDKWIGTTKCHCDAIPVFIFIFSLLCKFQCRKQCAVYHQSNQLLIGAFGISWKASSVYKCPEGLHCLQSATVSLSAIVHRVELLRLVNDCKRAVLTCSKEHVLQLVLMSCSSSFSYVGVERLDIFLLLCFQ